MASFEGAQGYGANATGGLGGIVIKVTNENNAGTGSLRDAIEVASGPRTVVFGVNNVNLTGDVSINSGDITVDGRSAGGVQVRGGKLSIRASNVIMRWMMWRVGDDPAGADPDSRDSLSVNGNNAIQDIMIDHCSFEWSIDEAVEVWKRVSKLTFSNNIFAQALNNSLHAKGEHSMGMLIASGSQAKRASQLSIFNNLFAFNNWRNPRIADGTTIELINNFTYGSGKQDVSIQISDTRGQSAEQVNIINNHFQAGPDTVNLSKPPIKIETSGNYASGNIAFDVLGDPITPEFHGAGTGGMRSTPDFSSGVTVMDASLVRAFVLANAGANPQNRDSVDQRIIDLIINGQGGLVDSVAEAGGYASTPFPSPVDPTPPDDPTIALLEAQIVELEAQVVSLNAEIVDLEAQAVALQDLNVGLEAQVTNLTADLSEATLGITTAIGVLTAIGSGA